MPLYDYKCPNCGTLSTVSRSISEKETNPECGTCHIALNRVYSSVGVTFNGSGFYSTDK